MDPDIVLLGLILVSFLPLNIFPQTSPPISDNIATSTEYRRYILRLKYSDSITRIKYTNPDK